MSAVTTTNESPTFARLLRDVLIRPRQAFAALAAHKSRAWIGMALLGLLLVTLPPIVSGPVTAQQIRETFANQEFASPPGAEMPENFDPASFAASPITTTVFPAVGVIFGLLFGWLIWSGALHLVSSLTGGRSSFGQMVQVVIWGWLPFGLRNLLQTVYIAASGTLIQNPGLSGFVSSGATPENPLAAATLSPATMALRSFLGQIDIYLFWNLALLVIGITAVSQLPRRKATGVVLVVWAVFMLLRVVAAAAAGGIAGAFAP